MKNVILVFENETWAIYPENYNSVLDLIAYRLTHADAVRFCKNEKLNIIETDDSEL
jgi:hypothetical protein